MTMTDDDQIDALSYVLALMDGEERREFELALLDDSNLAEMVWTAETELAPLAEALPPRKPSPRVLRNIEKSLFAERSVAPATKTRGTPVALAFWRSAATLLGVAAVAAIALAAVAILRPETILSHDALVAAMVDADDSGITLARLGRDGTLVTAPFAAAVEAGQDAELWLVIEGASPVSLGILHADEGSRLKMPQETAPALLNAQLVVTAEPEGGSPTGAPTGPALAKGGFQSL